MQAKQEPSETSNNNNNIILAVTMNNNNNNVTPGEVGGREWRRAEQVCEGHLNCSGATRRPSRKCGQCAACEI